MKFPIFETRIGVYETYDEAFKKDVLEQALSFESTEGRFVSNMGGFQSIDVGVTGAFSSFVKEFVLPNFKEFLQEDFLNEDARLGLESMWVNINYPFSTNALHTHPHCDFAFVYYCQASEKSGDLVFEHPDPTQQYQKFLSEISDHTRTPSTSIIYRMPPKEGRIVFFPANTPHRVNQNTSEESRVSIAGNLVVSLNENLS